MSKIIIDGVTVDSDDLKAFVAQQKGGQFKDKKKTKTLCEEYAVKSLSISNLCANVEIESWSNKSQVKLEVVGPEDAIDALRTEVVGETVKLYSDLGSSSHVVQINNNDCFQEIRIGNSITIGKNISINSDNFSDAKLRVKAYVPIGAGLKLSGVDGKTKIGRVGGKLRAKISGNGSLIADLVKTLHLKISGSGTANIREVYNDVSANISGQGNVTIVRGEIGNLEAKISGMGSITINATAHDADLSMSGMGNIYLRRCLNRPHRHKSGMGSITIDQIG